MTSDSGLGRQFGRYLRRKLRGLFGQPAARKVLIYLLAGILILDLVLTVKILGAGAALGLPASSLLSFSGVASISTLTSTSTSVSSLLSRQAGQPSPQKTVLASMTPFLPQTFTPTATATPPPTSTPSPTSTSSSTPSPTPEPPTVQPATAVPLPDTAVIPGVSGRPQSLPLSCESRSAADWAHFFGYQVNELEFQNQLPRSDNPELGFVGNPRDAEGRIPPHSYGVYAGPVAVLLRSYGVPARAFHGLGFDDIRREIAEGRPVIVWVVGGVLEGKRVEYTASDGQTVPVVALEHTVMVVGYSPQVVVIQDGGMRYQVGVQRFRNSWRVLGSQAIFAQ